MKPTTAATMSNGRTSPRRGLSVRRMARQPELSNEPPPPEGVLELPPDEEPPLEVGAELCTGAGRAGAGAGAGAGRTGAGAGAGVGASGTTGAAER